MRHLYDIRDLDSRDVLALLDRAQELSRNPSEIVHQFRGLVVGLFFFEASTRTRLGFRAAIGRLGASAIELHSTRYEPGMLEPESELDSFRSVAGFADLVILRHHDQEAFESMLAQTPIPVINAGSGSSRHPTQALVDLFAIRSLLGRIEGLRIGIVGDLSTSRATKSLVTAFKFFPPKELRLIAPRGYELPPGILAEIPDVDTSSCEVFELSNLDVLYMAGFPLKRHSEGAREDLHFQYCLTVDKAQALPRSAIILSPLPRIDEIDRGVDRLPTAAYFEQSRLGQFIRIALIESWLRMP